MILLRHRGTKEGQTRIVDEMLDGARITLHLLLDQGEDALTNRMQRLRLHPCGLGHHGRQGTGEHRDLLAFPTHGMRHNRTCLSGKCTCWGSQRRMIRQSLEMFLNRRHKTIATATDRLDHPLGTAAIPDGPTRRRNDPL